MKTRDNTNAVIMGNAARLSNGTTTTPATELRPGARDGEPSEPARANGLNSVARTQPDPEVKPARRRYTAQYKLKILEQLDNCKNSGDVGALLRREGLYSSHLTKWRRQREAGALTGLQEKKRGVKPNEVNPLSRELARLQRENERLQMRLKQAETIIEVQKKVSQLLGICLPETGEKS
jgi:transposase